jgi:hypothetical protein
MGGDETPTTDLTAELYGGEIKHIFTLSPPLFRSIVKARNPYFSFGYVHPYRFGILPTQLMFAPHVIGALVPAVPASLKNTASTLWTIKKPRLLTATRAGLLNNCFRLFGLFRVFGF